MKPEHTKPFNLKHAKAGAPYCQRSDFPARVGIWDSKDRNGYVLNGSVDSGDGSELHMQWTEEGICSTGFASSDLVMLPLGMCEGRPVFVGDELQKSYSHQKDIVNIGDSNFANHIWPRTAPVMPIMFPSNSAIQSTFEHIALYSRVQLEHYWKQLDEFNGVKV